MWYGKVLVRSDEPLHRVCEGECAAYVNVVNAPQWGDIFMKGVGEWCRRTWHLLQECWAAHFHHPLHRRMSDGRLVKVSSKGPTTVTPRAQVV
jgi:hypothetical protein